MNPKRSRRREFLTVSGSIAAGGWLSLTLPLVLATAQTACSKREQGDGFVHLESRDAADLEAIAEQILPSGDTPGAREAQVIRFIDQALDGAWHEWVKPIKDGLDQLNGSLDGGMRFADLDWAQQTAILLTIEETPFFAMLHFLTVAGMFSLPEYGGNRDKLGWALLGFQDRHHWQPPFGHYDQDYSGGSAA